MDEFEEFREDLIWGFLLIAAGAHSVNAEDQYDTARDFREAITNGQFRYRPDEGLRTQLARAVKQDKKKWTDK